MSRTLHLKILFEINVMVFKKLGKRVQKIEIKKNFQPQFVSGGI